VRTEKPSLPYRVTLLDQTGSRATSRPAPSSPTDCRFAIHTRWWLPTQSTSGGVPRFHFNIPSNVLRLCSRRRCESSQTERSGGCHESGPQLPRRRLLDPVFLQAHVELAARQAETVGRTRLVPPAFVQHLRDGLALDRAQIGRCRARRFVHGAKRQVLGADQTALAENRRAFENIPELPDVAWPVITEQGRRRELASDNMRSTNEVTRIGSGLLPSKSDEDALDQTAHVF
jgi:hypothetical protein